MQSKWRHVKGEGYQTTWLYLHCIVFILFFFILNVIDSEYLNRYLFTLESKIYEKGFHVDH